MKETTLQRAEGRLVDEMRPITFQRSYLDFAEGSCLVSFGRTRVICAASIDDRIPPFLLGSGQGWITAEYSMLPKSTRQRTSRDRAKSGRSQEIQRLIGRSLRSITDLNQLGERTLYIDCDVVQADGGTRSAAISGAVLALHDALAFMKKNKILREWPLREMAAAVSVGLVEETVCLDLDFSEDSVADVDFNVVMTETGRFIEIQGTAEHNTFDLNQLSQFLTLAGQGIQHILRAQREALEA
ncbi:MAG: ribonuclease PH [bacterium]